MSFHITRQKSLLHNFMYCDMTPEKPEVCNQRNTTETSTVRQRLVRHVSLATTRVVETKALLRN
jgi:hypothetical protein